jgi:hypothetical protein
MAEEVALPIASTAERQATVEAFYGAPETKTYGSDIKGIQEAVDDYKRRRGEEEAPIIVHKTRGDGPLKLNEAVDNLQYSRGVVLGEELRRAGVSGDEIDNLVVELAKGDPGPSRVGMIDDKGNEIEPLGREIDRALSPAETADYVKNWRAKRAAEQAELFARITGEAEAQQLAEQQQANEQRAPEPQQQPQQPDPVAQERQRLAAERAAVENIKRMGAAEYGLAVGQHQLMSALAREFGDITNMAEVEALKTSNPQRYARLQQAVNLGWQQEQQLGALRTQRQAHETRVVQHQQAVQMRARENWNRAADQKFEEQLAQEMPHYVEGPARKELSDRVEKMLKASGMTDQQIAAEYNGGSLRTPVAQMALAKAAAFELMTERAQRARQSLCRL